jgi:hypothetical protein
MLLGWLLLGLLTRAGAQTPDIIESIDPETGMIRLDLILYATEEQPKGNDKPICYSYLPWKWNTLPLHLVINPTGSPGLSEQFLVEHTVASAEAWNRAAHVELSDLSPSVDYTAPRNVDAIHTVSFLELLDTSVLAFISAYGTGTNGFDIIGFDIVFNTRIRWGDASMEFGVMDFQAVMSHELGHAIGLDHVFDRSCIDATMWFGISYGDISDRTPEKAESKAVRKLYKEVEVLGEGGLLDYE